MDALSLAAASGMRARQESLEMLANNLANQASPGFKADREFYSLYLSPEAMPAAAGGPVKPPTVAPLIERQFTDFTQGVLQDTGNALDLALSGPGFFVVRGPQGPLYTRNGQWRISPRGEMETQDGYPVLDVNNRPIRVDPLRAFTVAPDGQVRQGIEVVGRIAMADFPQSEALVKRSGTYFQWNGPAGGRRSSPAEIHQGRLEAANFAPAEAAVRLIGIMRQFEALQKAMQIGGEMGRRLEDIARPGT